MSEPSESPEPGRRRTPSSGDPRRRRRRRRLRWLGLGMAITTGLMMIWGFVVEPALLATERHTLAVPRWPGSLHGLRVVVLTDLHVGAPHIDLEQLDEVIERTNAEQPDLVVVLGDLVIQGVVGGDFVAPEDTARALGRLRARHGVVAVLGNHDWWLDGRRVAAALRQQGVVVLENEAWPVEHEGTRLWLAGLADLMTRTPDIAASLREIPDDEPVLLLTHNPDVFPDVPQRVSLTLAGHTHGGQVRVPLLGPPVVPSRYGQRYAAGHVVEDGRHLYVSVGVGTSILPVRFLVWPRIDVLTLDGAGLD